MESTPHSQYGEYYFSWEIYGLYDLVFFENLLGSTAAKKSNFGPLHTPRASNETAAVRCSAEVSLLTFSHGFILLNLEDGLYVTQGANFSEFNQFSHSDACLHQ